MSRPSNRRLLRWWAATEARYGHGPWTCTDCGRIDSGAYVQPQHPLYLDPDPDGRPQARCVGCIDRRKAETRLARKAQLAAEPRCGVPTCSRRGAWTLRGVLLCGAHMTKAQRAHSREASRRGGLALFVPIDCNQADILQWAQEG